MTGKQSRSTTKYLLFVALLTAPSMASATSIFDANVNSSPFIFAGECSAGPTNLPGTTLPGSVGLTCGNATGVGSAGAASGVGHVGTFANATAIGNGGVAFFQGNATWTSDFLVTGGPVGTQETLSVNFSLGADLGGLGADLSTSEVFFGIGLSGTIPAGGGIGVFDLSETHSTQGDSCSSIPVDFCGTALPGHFVTPTFNVFVGVPFSLAFTVSTDVLALGDGASGSVDASHSLDLILNEPVFNFSDPGFTAQGGDCIVNNIFVCSSDGSVPSAVPEPTSWAMMLAGLFSLGAALRGSRRRRSPLAA